MTQQNPLYYQSPAAPFSADLSHLKTLTIMHYVLGGIQMLFSSFGLIYVVLGILFLSGAMNTPAQQRTAYPGASMRTTSQAAPPPEIGYLFLGLGTCITGLGWALGICNIISGRKMAKHQGRTFSIVIAAIDCVNMPFGTVLGVFTLIVLLRDSVKTLYENNSYVPAQPLPPVSYR